MPEEATSRSGSESAGAEAAHAIRAIRGIVTQLVVSRATLMVSRLTMRRSDATAMASRTHSSASR